MANILLLEEDPIVARAIARILSIGDGHFVITALDREEFEARLAENLGYFDLVVSDWKLPRETGWDILMSNTESIPRRVLFLSGNFPEDFADKARELEAKDKIVFRLNKPLKVKDLLDMVGTLLAT